MRKTALLFLVLLLGSVQAGAVLPNLIQMEPKEAMDLVNADMARNKDFTIETEGSGQLSGFSAEYPPLGNIVVLFIRPPFRVRIGSANPEFLEVSSAAHIDAVRPLTLTFLGVQESGGPIDFTTVDPANSNARRGPIECKNEQFVKGVRLFSSCTFHVSQLRGIGPHASLNPNQAPVAFVGDTLQYLVFEGNERKLKKIRVDKAKGVYRVENSVPKKQTALPVSQKATTRDERKKTLSGVSQFEAVKSITQTLSGMRFEPSGYTVEITNARLIQDVKGISITPGVSLLLLSAPFILTLKGSVSTEIPPFIVTLKGKVSSEIVVSPHSTHRA